MKRIIRLLLRLYPASFRNEYGSELRAVASSRRADMPGFVGAVKFLIEFTIDTIGNAVAVHLDLLRQDLGYAARSFGRSPAFALTAILVTALGIGANAAAFSVADFVLIRPLPFASADRLVAIWEHPPGNSTMELSPPDYRDWKDRSRSFEAMGAYHGLSANLIGQGEPTRLDGVAVAGDLLPMLGVQPALGRLLSADEVSHGSNTVLLSFALWHGQFGGDATVVGRAITLDGASYVVVGVMPQSFGFPDRNATFWTPMRADELSNQERSNNWFLAVGRLRRGVTVAQAQSDLARIASDLATQFPKELGKTTASVVALRDQYSSQARMLLLALCGAAACILLIACANLANLLLARAIARKRELAVRTALGAGRERLVRQLLTEALLLSTSGGVLGVAIAVFSLPLLARLVPDSLPIAQQPSIDVRVLIVAALLTVLTGIGFGVIPAIGISRRMDLSALRDGNRAGGGQRQRLRAALVVAEISVSVVLLISAGLLMRAMWRIQQVDPGFRAEHVLTLRTTLPTDRYPQADQRSRYYRTVLDGVRQVPGVQGAAYASFLPMAMGGGIWPVAVNGETGERTADRTASLRFVTPGYFAAMQIPLLRGRDLAESDIRDAVGIAVVSESFAKRYWPAADPIGQRFKLADSTRMVVGVVHDVRVRGLERVSEPQVYLSYQQFSDSSVSPYYAPKDLVVRSNLPTAELLGAIRRIVKGADPALPISNVRAMIEIVASKTASRTVQLRVLAAFAAIALLLAGVGIHGLLAFSVSQRAREIGVRLALGSAPRGIVAMLMRESAVLGAAGLLIGGSAGYAAARSMASLLAGIEPGDFMTFGAVLIIAATMTFAGSLLPVLRAVRVDPASVLRTD